MKDQAGKMAYAAPIENKPALKSKTINFNAAALALNEILKLFGVDLPPDTVVAFLTLGNILLRLATDKALKTG